MWLPRQKQRQQASRATVSPWLGHLGGDETQSGDKPSARGGLQLPDRRGFGVGEAKTSRVQTLLTLK